MPYGLPSANVFAVLVIFARVGAAIAFLPGFSAVYVPMRMRLLIALAMSVLLTPTLSSTLPPMPDTPVALALLLLGESAVGLFLGSVARIFFAALQTAGTVHGLPLFIRERAGAGSCRRPAELDHRRLFYRPGLDPGLRDRCASSDAARDR